MLKIGTEQAYNICCSLTIHFLRDIDYAQRGYKKGYTRELLEPLDKLVEDFKECPYVHAVLDNPDKFINEFLRLNEEYIEQGKHIQYTQLYTYLKI